MAEYIDLNNTEVLAEAGENAKLVVEEDGELKRIPASAVGQVKTVNGVEPDEAGNVDVSYNNLLDKPFYEEELLSVKPTVDRNNIGFVWRKVSDNNLSTQLENGLNAQAWIDGQNGPINVAVVGDFVIYGEFFAVFVKKANAVLDPAAMGDDRLPFIATFPEAGMYFLEKPERMLLLGLAVAGASEPEIAWDGSPVRIKPLDAKFLTTTVPVIQSATVGQTVVVKAVDESGKPTEWEAVDMSAGGGGAMIVRFTPESDSTVVSDTDIATVCEAMEAGRAVMGYFSLGGAKLMVGNPVEYMSPQTNTAGQIKFRFTSMSAETSMNVIDLLLTNTGVMINNFTIGSTT